MTWRSVITRELSVSNYQDSIMSPMRGSIDRLFEELLCCKVDIGTYVVLVVNLLRPEMTVGLPIVISGT